MVIHWDHRVRSLYDEAYDEEVDETYLVSLYGWSWSSHNLEKKNVMCFHKVSTTIIRLVPNLFFHLPLRFHSNIMFAPITVDWNISSAWRERC